MRKTADITIATLAFLAITFTAIAMFRTSGQWEAKGAAFIVFMCGMAGAVIYTIIKRNLKG